MERSQKPESIPKRITKAFSPCIQIICLGTLVGICCGTMFLLFFGIYLYLQDSIPIDRHNSIATYNTTSSQTTPAIVAVIKHFGKIVKTIFHSFYYYPVKNFDETAITLYTPHEPQTTPGIVEISVEYIEEIARIVISSAYYYLPKNFNETAIAVYRSSKPHLHQLVPVVIRENVEHINKALIIVARSFYHTAIDSIPVAVQRSITPINNALIAVARSAYYMAVDSISGYYNDLLRLPSGVTDRSFRSTVVTVFKLLWYYISTALSKTLANALLVIVTGFFASTFIGRLFCPNIGRN